MEKLIWQLFDPANESVGSMMYYEKILLHASEVIKEKLHNKNDDVELEKASKMVRRNNQYMVNACNFLYNFVLRLNSSTSILQTETIPSWKRKRESDSIFWSLELVDILVENMELLVKYFHDDFLYWIMREKKLEIMKRRSEYTVTSSDYNNVNDIMQRVHNRYNKFYETNTDIKVASIRVKFLRAILYELDHITLYNYLSLKILENQSTVYEMRELLDFFNRQLCRKRYGPNDFQVWYNLILGYLKDDNFLFVINFHKKMIDYLTFNNIHFADNENFDGNNNEYSYRNLYYVDKKSECLPYDLFVSNARYIRTIEYMGISNSIKHNIYALTQKTSTNVTFSCMYLVESNNAHSFKCFDLLYCENNVNLDRLSWSERLELAKKLNNENILPTDKNYIDSIVVRTLPSNAYIYTSKLKWLTCKYFNDQNTVYYIKTGCFGKGSFFMKVACNNDEKQSISHQHGPMNSTKIVNRLKNRRYRKLKYSDLAKPNEQFLTVKLQSPDSEGVTPKKRKYNKRQTLSTRTISSRTSEEDKFISDF